MTNYDEEMLFEENEFEFESVKIDSKAPSFNLPFYDPKKDNDGKISLKDLKWKWSVLFFYPADFTFVCPTDQKEKFKELKVKVLAVSTDTIFSHRAWTRHELLMKDFPYKMLADHTGEISEKYNILDHETGMAARWTFIIDPDLNIKWIEVTSWPLGRNSDELIRKLEALQFMREHPTQACPAKWAVWAKTITPSIKISGEVGEELNKPEKEAKKKK